ncbi:MAG: hypothetical protein Q4G03_07005 [Planctomycetia bacterium]|nr:hypothetical protein [Planctomycetia bacterium]
MAKSKRKRTNSRPDPFARAPHPLGFQFLSDERPIRAVSFQAILPSVVAKYGLGRKMANQRLQEAWQNALRNVFCQEDALLTDQLDGNAKLELFLENTRATTLRAGALRIEIASNLLYQELLFVKSQLLAQLQSQLHDVALKSLKFVVR